MKFHSLIALCFSGLSSLSLAEAPLVFIGPTLSYEFGGGQNDLAIGIEPSIWTDFGINGGQGGYPMFPLVFGADMGVQYHLFSKAWSVYGEVQTGFAVVGASTGLVYHSQKGIGAQATVWANAYLGVWGRYQYFLKPSAPHTFGVGAFGKLPISTMLE